MTEGRLPLTLIAAVARNGIIGRGNRMPWRLPGDMAHFRAATMGRPVLIGRRTLESIGAALPGRPTIVVSRQPDLPSRGADIVPDLAAGLACADRIGRRIGAGEIMVAGGAAIYAALIAEAETLLITEVGLAPEGDAMFPPIDPTRWREAERIPALRRADDDAPYCFVRYRRASQDHAPTG